MDNYNGFDFEDISSKSEDISSFGKDSNIVSGNKNSIDLNSFATKDNEKNNFKKNKRKAKKKTAKERIIKIILSTFLVGVIVVSFVIGAFIFYAFTMVDSTVPQNLDDLKINFTTTIYVRDKSTEKFVEYKRLHGEFNRIWVDYDASAAKNEKKGYTGIPQRLVNAFVAIEDKRFYTHYGVDWKRTTAAFANMFLHFYSSNQGGSTITQQLVKNLTSDDEQKASRKLREIMRARYLESHYAKDTIMECYLNTIAMGHGLYGVGVAANYYFDKNVSELTLAECASIAAITKSPSNLAPNDNPENNEIRRKAVLKEMLDQGYIKQEEYDAAVNEKIKVSANNSNNGESDVNSYAIDAIIRQVTLDIAKKKNYDDSRAADDFYSGGYKIYSTIDPTIQNTVDSVFSDSDTYGLVGADGSKLQGSFTMLDYSGNVIALSGGIGKKAANLGLKGLNRATDAIRQPGSTMKPIAAYAPAIEKKLIHYSSIVNDSQVYYGTWKPNNWYGGYWGNITVQYALERSVNTIPVYLVDKLTPDFCYQFLTEKLGITTLNEEDKNLSPLGMGGTNGGITTMESAAAYAVFGNGGLYYKPMLYYKVCDQYDNVVLENKATPSVAIGEDTATVMNELLQNVVYGANGTGGGARSFIPNMRVYAKTGTSNNQNDLWFVGGTPYYIASCWCGYDQQQAISQSTIAMKMWGAVMSKVHEGLAPKKFERSKYAAPYYYCTATGGLATDQCPNKAVGWYKTNNIPGACTAHGGTVMSKADPDAENTPTEQNSAPAQ